MGYILYVDMNGVTHLAFKMYVKPLIHVLTVYMWSLA